MREEVDLPTLFHPARHSPVVSHRRRRELGEVLFAGKRRSDPSGKEEYEARRSINPLRKRRRKFRIKDFLEGGEEEGKRKKGSFSWDERNGKGGSPGKKRVGVGTARTNKDVRRAFVGIGEIGDMRQGVLPRGESVSVFSLWRHVFQCVRWALEAALGIFRVGAPREMLKRRPASRARSSPRRRRRAARR